MPLNKTLFVQLRRVLPLVLFVLLASVTNAAAVPSEASAKEGAKINFNLPAGEASKTLKQFAQQAKREIMFPTQRMDGMKANAVQGEMTVREGLDRLLAGTDLQVFEDAKTGALVVQRTDDPNAPRVALTEATTPKDPSKGEDGRVVLDKYEVNGSRIDGLNNKTIFRTDEKAPLPYNVISREEIERMGATSIQEVFRALPQVTNYGFSTQKNVSMAGTIGGDTLSQDSVGLRGFANSQTVVLVNGRRINGVLALSNISSFAADISKIPIQMIERIEVLPDSAAAIYGGGAIGGAINVILRKNYNAQELTAYYGTSTEGGGAEYHLSYLQGLTFGKGKDHLTVTLDYTHRNAVTGNQRDYYSRALAKYPSNTKIVTATGQSAFEVYILPAFASMPGTLVATAATGTQLNIPGNPTARFAALPAGLTDAQAQALTPASFTATAGLANLGLGSGGGPRLGQLNLYTPNQTYSWDVDYEHTFIPEKLSMFFEFAGSHARLREQYPQFLSISLSATNPLNPFRTGVTPGFVGVAVTYRFNDPDVPLASTSQDRDDARAVLGFKGKINSKWEWTIDVASQYTRTLVSGVSPDSFLSTITTRAGPGEPGYLGTPQVTGGPIAPTSSTSYRWTNVYDPFADHTLYPISAATIANYFYSNRLAVNYERTATFEGRLAGSPFTLPAGDVVASTGFDIQATDEISNQFGFFAPGLTDPAIYGQLASNNGLQNQNAHTTLTDRGYYAETTVPVFGKRYQPLHIYSLDLGGSYRLDRPNHARGADTKTLFAALGLTPDLAVRASVTDGYTLLPATSLTEPVTNTNVSTANVIDPMRGNIATTVVIPTIISGGNPALQAQSGRSRNVGVILTPRFLKGFSWQIDYWRIRQYNTPATPGLNAMLATPVNYPDRVVRSSLTPADQALGYTGGALLSVNTTLINIAQVNSDGIDSRLSYRMQLSQPGWGELSFTANTTFTNSYRTQALPVGPALNVVGDSSGNNPLKWKGYAQINWTRNSLNVGIMANYTDKFKTATTAPSPFFPTASGVDGDHIPSMTTFNLILSYNFHAKADGKGWRNWLSGTKWTVGCLNIFDRQPPLVSDSSGFYSQYADPRQRYPYIQVTKTF